MSAEKSISRGSFEVCYNSIEVISVMIDASYFQNVIIEKRQLCIVMHRIFTETNNKTTIKSFIDKQLDKVTDYLLIAFKIIIYEYDEIIEKIAQRIEDPNEYENEGHYLMACDTSKKMHSICQSFNDKRKYLTNPNTLYIWQKVTRIDDPTYVRLKLILELEN
jgi:hypothetical protein